MLCARARIMSVILRTGENFSGKNAGGGKECGILYRERYLMKGTLSPRERRKIKMEEKKEQPDSPMEATLEIIELPRIDIASLVSGNF